MKPTKLVMKAFGSYAEETVVNFDQLTGDLFLIVGKTGAGKTTIFDAISFALFGQPSGSERTVSMLHSDFVPKSESTEVLLDFVHHGRAYHIERRIIFHKKRGADEYSAEIKAVMTGEDQEPVNTQTKVNERCEELLGLNADQFSRIVMLAQGEFREFLKANSEKKNEILGKLFDSAPYVRYQELLDSVRGRLKSRNQEQEAEIAAVMRNMFTLPEGENSDEDFLPGHPRLTDNLRALIQREEAGYAELSMQCAERQKEVERLNRLEGAARTDNALLAELEQKRAHLAQLDMIAGRIGERREEYTLAEKALHRVKPHYDAVLRAGSDYENTLKKLSEQQAVFAKQSKAVSLAQSDAENDAPAKEEAERLSSEAGNLAATLPRYKELADNAAGLADTREQLGRARKALSETEAEKEDLSRKLAAAREELNSLEGCEAEAARLAGILETAKERYSTVSEPEKGISAQVDGIMLEEGALVLEREKLSKLTRDAAQSENEYHALYQAFLEGQAGLIASEMERQLSESGQTICPVCNTLFRKGEEHRFAVPSERVPSKEEVDRAERHARASEKKRQEKQSEIEKRNSLLDQQKENAANLMRGLDSICSGWGVLCAPGYINSVMTRLRDELELTQKAYEEAITKSEKRKALAAAQTETAEALESVESRITRQTELCRGLEGSILGLQSAVEEMKKTLKYEDQAAAQSTLDSLRQRIKELRVRVESHENALKTAKQAADITAGGIRTLEESLPGLLEKREEYGVLLTDALAGTGFADIEAALSALVPIGTADGERWLLERKQELDDYAHDRDSTASRIKELKRQTVDKSFTDLEELETKLDKARALSESADNAASAHKNLLESHRRVLDKVSAAKDALARTACAYRRITDLADLAVGSKGEGGKLSFDRYVMGSIFREVLEMANKRLDIMTGGRFELIHAIDVKRKNAVAGLEIEILDVSTGKRRPSGSISGGEGFMVSLALALGLSDVVQSHAGGIQLDTLFIDEGFGTLDDGRLDNVISILKQLTEGSRLVGIISHVDKLEESIPQKLRVTTGEHGSTLRAELS